MYSKLTAVFGHVLILVCSGMAQSLNPTGSITVHDPVMIKEGAVYSVFSTGWGSNNGIAVTTSSNLINWAGAGEVFSTMPAWHAQLVPNKAGNLWAPDISFRNGTYWLYYSVSSFGSQTSAIGLATRTSLVSGAWADQGMVITSSTFPVNDNAIDPNIISDTQGNVWMNWGSWWNGVYIVQLNPQTGKPQTGATATHIAGRGGSGIEGSFIIWARGYYHLFTSWDNCCQGTNSNYNMRYGRSANVTGPYVDKAGTLLTSGGGTLLSDGSGNPGGHNAIFEENGNFYLVYHVYDGRNNPASLQIRRLFFDIQNWPTLDPAQAVSISPSVKSRLQTERSFHRKFFNLTGRMISEPKRVQLTLPMK